MHVALHVAPQLNRPEQARAWRDQSGVDQARVEATIRGDAGVGFGEGVDRSPARPVRRAIVSSTDVDRGSRSSQRLFPISASTAGSDRAAAAHVPGLRAGWRPRRQSTAASAAPADAALTPCLHQRAVTCEQPCGRCVHFRVWHIRGQRVGQGTQFGNIPRRSDDGQPCLGIQQVEQGGLVCRRAGRRPQPPARNSSMGPDRYRRGTVSKRTVQSAAVREPAMQRMRKPRAMARMCCCRLPY